MTSVVPLPDTVESIVDIVQNLAQRARDASYALGVTERERRDEALRSGAKQIRSRGSEILKANAKDVEFGRDRGLPEAMIDRLLLNGERIEAMAVGLEAVAGLRDPLGRTIDEFERPNGLRISRVSVPLGVIGIIYESRPNVTADAGALCLKSGNAAILRGGSESLHSSGAIAACLQDGLEAAGLPASAVQTIPTRDRTAVGAMLRMSELIDFIVPRGGRSLIERVMEESRIPVIAHLDGNCHVYIHASANPEMARRIVVNAKMRRTGICGAAESLIVDKEIAGQLLPKIIDELSDGGCEVRGDVTAQQSDPRIVPASEEDWSKEYLDKVISVRVVDGAEEAIRHVNRYGSHHTDSIVAENATAAETFLTNVDSAIVLHNASTQFADGGEFGMGAEIGISTGKLHARGPVGAEQLTSYKYVVRGSGQCRV
ncbi:MAG: Gamma-glutamyl phosphate reductase [Alphaproteobacteria bacterium MarineAlpha4_Bin2]|nr:MAG: Gamma-glutamyl phosphate reductase [Alphaproteobacteria bacterium MarineAlpha4_Bin2]